MCSETAWLTVCAGHRQHLLHQQVETVQPAGLQPFRQQVWCRTLLFHHSRIRSYSSYSHSAVLHLLSSQWFGFSSGSSVLQPVVHKDLLQRPQTGTVDFSTVLKAGFNQAEGLTLYLCCPQSVDVQQQLSFLLSRSPSLEELSLETSGLKMWVLCMTERSWSDLIVILTESEK